MQIEDRKQQLLELIRRGGVSMVEIMRLPEARGERSLRLGDNPMLIVWNNVAEDLIQALSELLSEGKIAAHKTNVLIYAIDGATLDLPIAKNPKRQYKTAHWLPVAFNLARQ